MSAQAETFQFKSEARQLLDLMIHSLYSHKEVFLRELISNSSDAIDKLRFEAVKQPDLLAAGQALELRIEADPEARTLTLEDGGIGMSRDEVIQNLGTIARSGTREFVKQLKEAQTEAGESADLIGQFGVGFYSAFMVAEEVTVVTRRAGDDQATRWTSTGDGTFSIEAAQRDTVGTTITLKLRPADEENQLADFTSEWVLRSTIKKYSDFIQHPIKLKTVREEKPRDEEGNPLPDAPAQEVVSWEVVNSMKALWTRPSAEITPEEYSDFYKHVARDWTDPLETIHFKAEGTFEYFSLLFIPERAPHDLFYRNVKFGLQLYVNRVMVMERTQDLLPDYLRFVRGVVDSPDLSLNVSREMLQKDRRVKQIKKRITKKTLDSLAHIQQNDAEKYAKFWGQFGQLIKEGVAADNDNLDQLKSLIWFQSTAAPVVADAPEGFVSLQTYVERMKPEQDTIYYITGESRLVAEQSPHLEAFKAKGYEVLLMVDPIDEVMLGHLTEFDGKKLQSVSKGVAELGDDAERKKADEDRAEKQKGLTPLFEYIQGQLDGHIKEVRLSSRLTESPVCLVNDEQDLSPHLERLLKQMGQQAGPSQKRILEINPDHPVLAKMNKLFNDDATSPLIADYAHLLHGQALLSEGSPLPDPIAFSRRVAQLMVKG
jgi:molecular chaperone HtpG